MIQKTYEPPVISRGEIFSKELKSNRYSSSFESKVFAQLQETINLIVSPNSNDYQTSFQLKKKRLKHFLNQQQIMSF